MSKKDDLLGALCRTLLENPPPDLNIAYLAVLIVSHRWEEIITMLSTYNDEKKAEKEIAKATAKLTPAQKEAYMLEPMLCPFCQSNDVASHGIEPRGERKAVDMNHCCDCKREWNDEYELVRIEEL